MEIEVKLVMNKFCPYVLLEFGLILSIFKKCRSLQKVFPELKRQREAKERVSRTAQRGLDTARSEADLAELCANLGDESAKTRRMKVLACVVPRLLDADERRHQFIDQNGRIGIEITKSQKTVTQQSGMISSFGWMIVEK